MAISQKNYFNDNPNPTESANTIVEIENGDEKSVVSVESFRVSNEENRFENMTGIFSVMAGDPYNEEMDTRHQSYCKSKIKHFFLSYRVLLLFIPILLALYVDSTIQLREARQQTKTLSLKSKSEFNTTELHLIAEGEHKQELMAKFNPDGILYLGPDASYPVKCLARRDFLVRKHGKTVEGATLELVSAIPACVKDEPRQDQNNTNRT